MKKRYSEGDKIGRLTLVAYLDTDYANKRLVLCKCDCGVEVTLRLNNLGRKTNSCGCLKADLIKERMGKPIEDLATRHVFNSIKRYTKDTDLNFDLVKKMIFSPCFYCEGLPENVGTVWKRPIEDGREIKRIGIDRIDSDIGYFCNNIVPCCQICNYIKRDHQVVDLISRLETMVLNLKRLKNES